MQNILWRHTKNHSEHLLIAMWYFWLCKLIDIVFHLRLIAAENIGCFVEISMQVCNSGSWIKNGLHCKKYRKYYSHTGSYRVQNAKATSKNAKNFSDVRSLLWVIRIGVQRQSSVTDSHHSSRQCETLPYQLLAFIWFDISKICCFLNTTIFL